MIKLDVEFSGFEVLSYEKKKLKAVLRAAGQEVMALAKRNIKSSSGSGRVYNNSGGNPYHAYKKGKYTASAPGQSPVNVTGDLASKLKVVPFPSGEGVAIRDNAFYSSALEHGASGGGRTGAKGKLSKRARKAARSATRVLAPRPFLEPALNERKASIEKRIAESVSQDIKFVRESVKRKK